MVNENIRDYLKFYCNKTANPQFAIMLKGSWGCGKTWFINDFIENNEPDRFLYISLYGLNTTKELDDKFFECLHPFLSSKSVKFIGKIAQSALRLGLKIPLTDETTIQGDAQLPQISLIDFTKDLSNKIVVFDDLERCNIEINMLLGYINTFVEHYQLKVILIGNELELSNMAKEQFYKSKEKIISQLFEVSPLVEEALQQFISQSSSEQCKEFLENSAPLINETFQGVGYKNLRDLRQSLINFEYLFSSIEEKFRSDEEFMKSLLKVFIYLSLEEKANEIDQKNWKLAITIFYSRNLNQKLFKALEEKEREKIENNSFFSSIIPQYEIPLIDLWNEIIFDGKIDKERLNDSIKNSKHFLEKNKNNLSILLSEWNQLTSEKFKKIFSSFMEEFVDKKYTHPSDILYALCQLLIFRRWGLIDASKAEIKTKVLRVINELSAEDKLEPVKFQVFSKNDIAGSYNLTKEESKIYEDVWSELNEKMEKKKTTNIQSTATNEINSFPETYRDFCRSLITVDVDGKYGYIPVLSLIDIDLFFSKYLLVPNSEKSIFMSALENRYLKRYSNGVFPKEYSDEVMNLKKLRKLFNERINEKGFLYNPDIVTLDWNLKRLEEIIEYCERK